MLLLSSATRILATKHPPTIPHPCMPRQSQRGRTESPSPSYWSILPSGRQRQRVTRVSEVNTVPTPPEPSLLPQYKKGCGTSPHPHFTSRCLSRSATTRERFSAALSFSCCSILFSCPLLRHSGGRLARALHPPSPHRWVARYLPSHLSWEFLPPLRQPPRFAESAVAGGALGSVVASEFGTLPSVGAATFSAAPAVPLLPPGVTVATIPVPVPDFLVWSPPIKMSTPVDVSDSGSNVGFPTREATCSSCPGPVLKNLIGFLTRLVLGRGAFCSAVIHATAFGSGCGTGAPSAFNRSFASGTRGDSG